MKKRKENVRKRAVSQLFFWHEGQERDDGRELRAEGSDEKVRVTDSCSAPGKHAPITLHVLLSLSTRGLSL